MVSGAKAWAASSSVGRRGADSRAAPRGLARSWGLDQLFVKRDDLTSSIYGGNKVRKLEWVLAPAQLPSRTFWSPGGATAHWLGSHRFLPVSAGRRQIRDDADGGPSSQVLRGPAHI